METKKKGKPKETEMVKNQATLRNKSEKKEKKKLSNIGREREKKKQYS